MTTEIVIAEKNGVKYPNLVVVLNDGTRIPVTPLAVSDKQRYYYRIRLLNECRKENK